MNMFFATQIGIIAPIISENISVNKINTINSNVNSIEKKLNILDDDVTKEQQIELFKDINVDDIISEITNKNSSLYSQTKLFNETSDFSNKNVYDEINNNIDHFKKIVENVLDGTITSTEIKQNLINYKNNNFNSYSELLSKIDISLNDEALIDVNNIAKNSLSSTEEFKKINDVTIIDDNNKKIVISADDLAFFTKTEKFLSRLKMYRDKTYGVSIVSATLTAASWAIAAFYWSAWWMFGANVPFALEQLFKLV